MHACRILRRYGLMRANWSDQDISWVKNWLGFGYMTWKEFIITICLSKYLNDTLPDEGIYIEELNVRFGGTLTIEVGKI
jgi:hypothetical protein